MTYVNKVWKVTGRPILCRGFIIKEVNVHLKEKYYNCIRRPGFGLLVGTEKGLC